MLISIQSDPLSLAIEVNPCNWAAGNPERLLAPSEPLIPFCRDLSPRATGEVSLLSGCLDVVHPIQTGVVVLFVHNSAKSHEFSLEINDSVEAD